MIELGISLQSPGESHKNILEWVTSGWLRYLWEKVDIIFDVAPEFKNIPLKMPRGGDEWLIQDFVRIGYGK